MPDETCRQGEGGKLCLAKRQRREGRAPLRPGSVAAGVGGPSSLWLRHTPSGLQQTLSPAPTCTELHPPKTPDPPSARPRPVSTPREGGGGVREQHSSFALRFSIRFTLTVKVVADFCTIRGIEADSPDICRKRVPYPPGL